MSESVKYEGTAIQGNQTPDERSTSFQAVQGEAEHYSGETLLVSAYTILWLILFGWVAFVWRKQNTIDARLGDLEREIDKADEKKRA